MSRVFNELKSTSEDVLNQIKDIDKEDFNKAVSTVDLIVEETWANALQSMSFGFTFASAMAWNEAIKMYIKKSLKTESPRSYFMYALGVTFATTLFLLFTKNILKRKVLKPKDIKYTSLD